MFPAMPCTFPVFLSTPSARRATPCRCQPQGFFRLFLSTPSARRATNPSRSLLYAQSISIHALREEGDLPKPPASSWSVVFLSTPSARRATDQTIGV